MIKINLASKKQVSYSGAERSEKTGTLTSIRALGGAAGSSAIVSILGRALVTLALCGVAYVGFDHWMESLRAELQFEASNIDKEKSKIQDELKKYSGFEKQRAELEKNLQLIQKKNETIESLIRGKDHTVKSLITLSQSLPKEVWITEITASEKLINLRGSTIDIALISDVMSKLGTSIYFKDVSLKGSASDVSGRQSTFELSARRE